MLTRDLTPCFVQGFGLGSRTGYEKALLVGLFDRTFTCLDHRISSTDEDAGPTRRPVAVVMRRDGRLQEERLVWRHRQRRRDGGCLHRGHQVLPVLR